MERESESCLLCRYDTSFVEGRGKAGEGESVLSKAGAVSDRAEAKATLVHVGGKSLTS